MTWINISVHLPPNLTDVLVCWPGGRQAVANRDSASENVLRDNGWFFALPHPVGMPTHWMPLPEPPK